MLSIRVGRRPLLKAVGTATLATVVGGGGPRAGTAASFQTLALSPDTPAAPLGSQVSAASETVYVFNVGSRDVALIDAATQQVRETRPLGAAVRWLSNEQRYWDGQYIWTYDFPANRLQAIAIDPQTVAITRTIADIGTGPGHSLMMLSNGKAAINVAGDNLVAFLDLSSGQVEATLPTGAFPWDLHLTPDGRFGYTPERDQDTVSKIDMATRRVLRTVEFPADSRPYMLRVSPDGKEVWVQTASADTNVVLDGDDLSVLATEPTGRSPVETFWTPDRRYSFVTHTNDTFVSVFDARTYREVARLEVGRGSANIGFTRDGATAFISIRGRNAVAVVDVSRLEVVSEIPVGTEPQGLIVL